MSIDFFSPSYAVARQRFLEAATQCGCRVESHPIGLTGPDGSSLSIDVAISDEGDASRCLLLSSGVHGVEGYFGSAAQLATLARWTSDPSSRPKHRWVMIHAVNPYGMAWRRRVNEDNIDLNRNFLAADQLFEGRPEGYEELSALLAPATKPSRLEPLKLKFVAAVARRGLRRLQHIVTAGQYDFPKGLFFGGKAASRSRRILEEHFVRWLGEATHVLHIDFHTGLGRSATYQMLIDHPVDPPKENWLKRAFGAEAVHAMGPGSVSAALKGTFGLWAYRQATGRDYSYAAAEFGTCNGLEVLTALRLENQCTQWAAPDSAATERAKTRLLAAFCPSSTAWRSRVLASAAQIVEQATLALKTKQA